MYVFCALFIHLALGVRQEHLVTWSLFTLITLVSAQCANDLLASKCSLSHLYNNTAHLCETFLVCTGLSVTTLMKERFTGSTKTCCLSLAVVLNLQPEHSWLQSSSSWLSTHSFSVLVFFFCSWLRFRPDLITTTEVWTLHNVTVEKWVCMVQQQHVLFHSQSLTVREELEIPTVQPAHTGMTLVFHHLSPKDSQMWTLMRLNVESQCVWVKGNRVWGKKPN